MGKLNPRKAKSPVQGHTGSELQSLIQSVKKHATQRKRQVGRNQGAQHRAVLSVQHPHVFGEEAQTPVNRLALAVLHKHF